VVAAAAAVRTSQVQEDIGPPLMRPRPEVWTAVRAFRRELMSPYLSEAQRCVLGGAINALIFDDFTYISLRDVDRLARHLLCKQAAQDFWLRLVCAMGLLDLGAGAC
jgi:hypothetical protein